MTAVVVDTDVVSFVFKRDRRARPFRKHLVGQTLVLSFMSLAELRAWPRLRNWGQSRRDDLERHLIDVADAWNAATAVALGIPLVTHNAADYGAVDGLTLLTT
jgi:tRNA(fMet)-specific endonuclease VapC